MAISAKFEADFSSFTAAVAAAETKLLSFEGNGTKVQASLERMEKSLSGQRLIQDATLTAQAVENIGGVSKLTEGELQRLGDQARAAMEKMLKMGVEVPPGIKNIAEAAREAAGETGKLGDAAVRSTPKTTDLGTSLRAVDGSLKTIGVNIGPAITVMDELGNASGKTAGQLGKLATAGAVLATGIAAFKGTRAVGEFFGVDWDKWDTKIGNATAKLLGFGDVAGQQAAAGAETLARASANAGRRITDMSEAIEINRKAVEAKLIPPVKQAALDIHAMREQMLKTEAARVIGPEVTPSVVALGRATIETTNNLTALEGKLKSVERLNDSITSRLQALSGDLDRQARERDARRFGGTTSIGSNSASITRNIEGRVTPLSERDAANTAKLEAMIAQLTKTIAEYKPRAFDAGAGPRASDLVLVAAQQHADDLRQLEYLRQLLSTASTGSTAPLLPSTALGPAFGRGNIVVTNHVTVSGVLDARTIRDLKTALDDTTMTTLKIGRQLGAN